jgi:hypothetical protein
MAQYQYPLFFFEEAYGRSQATIKRWSMRGLPMDEPDKMLIHLQRLERARLGQRKSAVTRVHALPELIVQAKVALARLVKEIGRPARDLSSILQLVSS